MDLKEWAVQYIKQKDMIKQDLVSYKEEENKVLCEYKEGKKAVFICKENLELDNIKNIKKDETFFLVCLCNEHNFKVLADNWDLFKTKQNLTFLYLNPGIAEKWIIKPFIHAKIADPITLKQGLRTMYESCLGTAKQ